MRAPRNVLIRLTRALFCVCLLPVTALAQKFAQPTVIPTGNWPAAVYSRDINGDGFPDLIYIDQGATPTASTAHVLLNDGTGTFTQSATLVTAGNSIAFGNFTGSGKVDIGWFTPDTLAPGNTFLRSHVAANLGNGTFAAPVSTLQFTVPDTFRAGYTTGAHLFTTGFDAFIVEDVQNNVIYTIQLYTSTSLGQGSTQTLPDGPGPIVVADLNRDGLLDFVVNGRTGSASAPPSAQVFLNHGPPGFAPYGGPDFRFTGISGVHSLLIQDVNLDGRPDLIAEGANGHIDVFFGNGDGTFQTTSSGGTGALDGTTGNGGHLIATGDFNRDGMLDAITATPIGISALLGNGTQYLGLKGIYNAGPGGNGGPPGAFGNPSYAVADFNHDSNLDLALDSPEGIAILYGNPDGSFQTSRAFAAGKPAMSSALGVLSASGKLDAAVSISSTTAQLLLGQGDGTFLYQGAPGSPAPSLTQTANPSLWGTIAATDLNSDGNLDLVVTGDGPAAALPALGFGITVGLGHGDGTFSVASLLNTHADAGGITFFGTSTAGSALGPSGSPGLIVLDQKHLWDVYNAPAPIGLSSTALTSISDPHAHNLVAAGNLHGGTLPDLIVEDQGSLKLYLNSASGFAAAPAGDLSVDGSLTTPGRAVAPVLSPTFGGTVAKSAGGLGFPAAVGSMVITDLDGDGNNDLLVAYDNMGADHTAPNANTAPNAIYIWYGSGGGKFLATARHPINPLILTPERNDYQLAIADINGDKIPDLIMSDGYVITVAYGVGDGTFAAEKHFLAGQGMNSISTADIDGDGKVDLVIANGGAVLSNPVANHEVLAVNPDVNTGGITVLINQTPPATLPGTITSSPDPSNYGTSFTITATEAGPGSFVFSVDGTPIGTVNISSGNTASIIAPGTYTPGTHIIGVAWTAQLSALALITTGTHQVLVNPTTLSLLLCVDDPGSLFPCGTPIGNTPLINPITFFYGQSIDGVATESSSNLTGSIIFYDGASIFCSITANLQGGSNACPPASGYFHAGTRTVYAAYTGDANNAPSTSNSIGVTVFPDPTAQVITSSTNPAVVGTPVTFMVKVVGNYATPVGTVIFFDGLTQIGTTPLDPTGQGSFTTSSLAVGSHPIGVAYAGNSDFLPAVTALLNQVITPLGTAGGNGFTLSITPSPVTIGAGNVAILLVTVTAQSPSTPAVALTCPALPYEVSCTFVNSTIPAGGGATTLQLHVSAPHDCNDPGHPYFIGSETTGGTPGLPSKTWGIGAAAALLALTLPRRRKFIRPLLLLLFSAALLGAFSGCGHCTDLGTRPGTYTFTVTASDSTESHSQTIPLTVTIP